MYKLTIKLKNVWAGAEIQSDYEDSYLNQDTNELVYILENDSNANDELLLNLNDNVVDYNCVKTEN